MPNDFQPGEIVKSTALFKDLFPMSSGDPPAQLLHARGHAVYCKSAADLPAAQLEAKVRGLPILFPDAPAEAPAADDRLRFFDNQIEEAKDSAAHGEAVFQRDKYLTVTLPREHAAKAAQAKAEIDMAAGVAKAREIVAKLDAEQKPDPIRDRAGNWHNPS
jgi:hypothetical protein